MSLMETSNQVEKFVPNPTGKGGFQERPQDRNPGHWDSKDSISFQYNKMIRMTEAELEAIGKKPKTERTMAERLAFQRVMAAQKSLPDMKEITDRTEGKAQQAIDLTSGGEAMQPILVRFIGAEDGNTDTN